MAMTVTPHQPAQEPLETGKGIAKRTSDTETGVKKDNKNISNSSKTHSQAGARSYRADLMAKNAVRGLGRFIKFLLKDETRQPANTIHPWI